MIIGNYKVTDELENGQNNIKRFMFIKLVAINLCLLPEYTLGLGLEPAGSRSAEAQPGVHISTNLMEDPSVGFQTTE